MRLLLDKNLRSGNPAKRAFRAAPVLVPLFGRAFLTAQNLSVAMDARGFGARPGRSSIITLDFDRTDRALSWSALAAVVLGIAFRIAGIGFLVEGLL